MHSSLRANRIVACARRLSFNCTRSFAFASTESRCKPNQSPNRAKVSPEPESDRLSPPATAFSDDVFAGGGSLAASLDHYHSLPPLPPIEKWRSHFPYSRPIVRDRVSIRTPATAIRVAQSFINSKKTSTTKPKVVIEAFPGAWCLGALVTLLLHPI
jgi:hypothetical protein